MSRIPGKKLLPDRSDRDNNSGRVRKGTLLFQRFYDTFSVTMVTRVHSQMMGALAQSCVSIVTTIETAMGQRCVAPRCSSQQTRHIAPMSVYCWSTVYDAGPPVTQHWVTVSCFLGGS